MLLFFAQSLHVSDSFKKFFNTLQWQINFLFRHYYAYTIANIFFRIFRRVVLIKIIDYSQTPVDYASLVTSVTQFFPILDHKTRTGVLNEDTRRKHSAESQIAATLKQTPRVFTPEGRE